ncbi:hypothetical protein [Photobacterium leiognathi]|uniref:hypothetical protein n=1 Tax=Photobacterium leiognathi TaxID=553611 RepID=UPI00298184EA|nr:hypothetical protein [Photobacterium leiognathi]
MALFDEAIQSVHEYHCAFGYPIGQSISDEIRTIRSNLVVKEAKTLKEALTINNHLEIVKGLVNCVYAAIGTIIAIQGLDLSFIDETAENIACVGLIGSMGNTVRQDLTLIADDLLTYAEMILNQQETAERIAEFGVLCVYRIEMMCDAMQIAIIPALKEVHRSNMTKLWVEDTEQRLEHIALDSKRYADIAFRMRNDGGDGMVGYRLSDGKTLKSPMYSKADLSPYFNEFLIEYLK